MSGIVGCWRQDGKPVKETVAKMLGALAHRGPDGANLWCDGAVGLGHVMLHTTPESPRDVQPMTAHHCVLTADARLDNRAELQAELGLRHIPAESLTDSQLLLLAYDKWGEQCVTHLLGDFAFAIWDARRHRLFCARDHLGVKPFYYYASSQGVIFASEIKALWCDPEVPRRADDLRVGYHLMFRDHPSRTFYQDIHRLPPAHTLTVTPEGVRTQRYWALDPTHELRLPSDEAYAERFAELFTEAVRCRLRTHHPVGSILSGGLDSSSITCVAHDLMAKDNRDTPLHTYSAHFYHGSNTDERPYVDAVLSHLRDRSVSSSIIDYRLDGEQLISTPEELARIMQHVEEPFWYGFLLVLWPFYRAARERGVRVLLDGCDGDSVLALNRAARYVELLRNGRWRAFGQEIGSRSRMHPARLWRYAARALRMSWRDGVKPLVWRPLRIEWKRWRQTWPRPINRAWARDIGLMAHFRPRGGYGSPPFRSAREAHYGALTHSAFPFHLEMLNRAASAFGLEHRHPFFDRRLVEFCLSLPPEQKLHRGMNRPIMRRALKPVLPEAVYHRPGKAFLSVSYLDGVLTSGSHPLCDLILEQADSLDRYVDADAMRALYHRHLTLGQTKADRYIWATATLALWLHGFGGSPVAIQPPNCRKGHRHERVFTTTV